MGDSENSDSQAPRRAQLEVLAGMAAAVLLSALIGWFLWHQIGITPRRIELIERLSYAAKWSLVPGACILVGVAMIANQRFFTPAIDPTNGYEDRALDIWRRYLQNTLEQSVLFVIGAMAFVSIAYQYWLKAIPICAVLFGVGRVLFLAGYLIRPTLRAAGFAMTFYPIIALYGVSIYLYWLA